MSASGMALIIDDLMNYRSDPNHFLLTTLVSMMTMRQIQEGYEVRAPIAYHILLEKARRMDEFVKRYLDPNNF
jgi:hypothetical protein